MPGLVTGGCAGSGCAWRGWEEAYSGPCPLALGLGILGLGSPCSRWGRSRHSCPSRAGLPSHVDAPQQSCVLPALHHQASLRCAVLQPPWPGLSNAMTGPPQPVGQRSQLLRDLCCLQGAVIPPPRPRLCSLTCDHGTQALKAADSWALGLPRGAIPLRSQVEGRDLLLLS